MLYSWMSPGFILTAAMVILECAVVLVNFSMTVVVFNDVHSVEVASWREVASHLVAEQISWLWTAHLQASDTVTKAYSLKSFHLYSHLMPLYNSFHLQVTWIVTNFLIQDNVNVLPWPIMSPDLLPKEHVWHKIQCHLCGLHNQLLMLPDLSHVFVRIWNGIALAFLSTLVVQV